MKVVGKGLGKGKGKGFGACDGKCGPFKSEKAGGPSSSCALLSPPTLSIIALIIIMSNRITIGCDIASIACGRRFGWAYSYGDGAQGPLGRLG